VSNSACPRLSGSKLAVQSLSVAAGVNDPTPSPQGQLLKVHVRGAEKNRINSTVKK
jgi:hypothetical protein